MLSKIIKFIIGIILFCFSLLGYYAVLAIGITLLLNLIAGPSAGDNGLWPYGMILGVILSPIVSFISTVKIIKLFD